VCSVTSELSNPPETPGLGFVVRYRTPISVALHAGAFILSLVSAFALAYNFRLPSPKLLPLFGMLLCLVLPLKLVVFWVTKQYRGSWRYVGLRDLFGVVKASYISAFLFVLVFFAMENIWLRLGKGRSFFDPSGIFAQSVFLLDVVATIVLVSAARIAVRFYYEEVRAGQVGDLTRVLIVGAGDSGEALLREILRMPSVRYDVVGFVDDQPRSQHARIHDVEVLGKTQRLKELCEREDVEEVFIALPGATPKDLRRVVELCQGTNVRFRTVPPAIDLIEGRVQVSQIRPVDIEDLLGRDPVALDIAAIGAALKGKRVMVTGAGGSIGSEMCRQIAAFEPESLILLEQAENNLFEIDRELRQTFPELNVDPVVADICDKTRVRALMRSGRPSAVFHAAAHKHVPMMEINPGEAVKNNVDGTRTVADAAVEAGVEKMVMISTDKAVNPTSIMGCTKRVAEMYVQQLSARSETQFVTVRFGNVLGSSGSVIPIFKKQIALGGPVTVTHPDMTRYFMTIPEAAQLVLQAGTMGRGGEIYVLDMGDPIRIVQLAEDMITLSGLRPGSDIEIVFSGIRPGEKLFEELSIRGEGVSPTRHPKIGIWRNRPEDWDQLCGRIEELLALADCEDPMRIRGQLAKTVPEFGGNAPDAGPDGDAVADSVGSDSALPEVGKSPAGPAVGV